MGITYGDECGSFDFRDTLSALENEARRHPEILDYGMCACDRAALEGRSPSRDGSGPSGQGVQAAGKALPRGAGAPFPETAEAFRAKALPDFFGMSLGWAVELNSLGNSMSCRDFLDAVGGEAPAVPNQFAERPCVACATDPAPAGRDPVGFVTGYSVDDAGRRVFLVTAAVLPDGRTGDDELGAPPGAKRGEVRVPFRDGLRVDVRESGFGRMLGGEFWLG